MMMMINLLIQNKNYTEAVEDLFSWPEKHMDKQPEEKRKMAKAQYQIVMVLGYHCQFDGAVEYLGCRQESQLHTCSICVG